MLFSKKKNDDKMPKRTRRVLKTPIALHFYFAFTVIIIFFFLSYVIGFNTNLLGTNYQKFIREECYGRIDKAEKSWSTFNQLFMGNVNADQYTDPEQFRNNYFNLISSSTDISNEASLAIFYEDPETEEIRFIYTSNFKTAKNLISDVIDKKGLKPFKYQNIEVKNSDESTSSYYYKIGTIDYKMTLYSEKYYVIYYVDASRYMSFADSLNNSMFNTMLVSIIIAGILSVIISLPIILSTRRLTKFASRISKGNFDRYDGIIASRELSSLADTMNMMATRLNENDKEQKTFFQNASHELRTPLMSIQGYAEGMKYGVFDKENEAEAVDIIISETTRLSNMVENLLSISKMDLSAANGYKVKKSIVNVYELVGVTIEKIRGGFLLNGKELVNNIKVKSNVHIYANENDIFRMLENVFSNCLRYAESKVFFNCYTTDRHVIFEISDDGPGISDEVKKHLFDRFAKGSDGKHGIGLALVLAIAKEHNGSVSGENKPEGGAVFKISIPILQANEQLSHQNKNQ